MHYISIGLLVVYLGGQVEAERAQVLDLELDDQRRVRGHREGHAWRERGCLIKEVEESQREGEVDRLIHLQHDLILLLLRLSSLQGHAARADLSSHGELDWALLGLDLNYIWVRKVIMNQKCFSWKIRDNLWYPLFVSYTQTIVCVYLTKIFTIWPPKVSKTCVLEEGKSSN